VLEEFPRTCAASSGLRIERKRQVELGVHVRVRLDAGFLEWRDERIDTVGARRIVRSLGFAFDTCARIRTGCRRTG
jgi:hypothetical protein